MNLDPLLADLRRDEGFVSHAYQDSEGRWTIGYGRLVDKALGGGITKAEAEHLLINDVYCIMSDLDQRIAWWRLMPEPSKRGLVNMAFNLGWPHLSSFVKMLAALESGEYDTAASEALDSKWAGQVGTLRSKRIALLLANN